MVRYEGQTWTDAKDSPGAVYEDIELVRCRFTGGLLGEQARHPAQRTIVRRVTATNCTTQVWRVGPAIFEDVHVSNLRTLGEGLWLHAPLLKHVTLSGKAGTVILSHWRWEPDPQAEDIRSEEAAFAADAEAFYATVDWALDISKAEFREFEWRLKAPTRLVRRDPETQVVVKREKALAGTWKTLPLDPIISIGLGRFLDFGLPETIIVASKGFKSFKDEFEGLKLLRKEGIAEPD